MSRITGMALPMTAHALGLRLCRYAKDISQVPKRGRHEQYVWVDSAGSAPQVPGTLR